MKYITVAYFLILISCAKQKIPDFPLNSMKSQNAIKGKLYITASGTIDKYTVYVSASELPKWVHELADNTIGKGKDEGYEIEQYSDGSEVYEIKRLVDGKSVEVSIRRDGFVKYIEKQVEKEDLPIEVKVAIGKISNFNSERISLKIGPDINEYQVRGKMSAISYRLRINKDGSLIAIQKQLPATIEVGVQ